MNMLSTVLAFVACLFSLLAVTYCLICMKYVRKYNAASVSLREMTKIQTELTEHADSIESLNVSLKKLRSRIGMRKLREDKANGDDMPDPKTDPAGWKAAMRLQMHKQRFK